MRKAGLKWGLDERTSLRSREYGQRGVRVTRSKFKFKAAKVTALDEDIKVRWREVEEKDAGED